MIDCIRDTEIGVAWRRMRHGTKYATGVQPNGWIMGVTPTFGVLDEARLWDNDCEWLSRTLKPGLELCMGERNTRQIWSRDDN